MSQLFVLYEHAAGYALFRISEVEELSMLLPQVVENIQDLAKFRSIAHLTAFFPFKTAKDALQNLNSLTEGVLHSDLQLFLETNVPKSKKKKQPVVLGVGDSKLGAAITEATSITCQVTGAVPEIMRGIRLHFPNLVEGLKGDAASKAQLGLGHNYSRAKVKFNVNRVDNMVIQSVGLVDLLDKDINTFSMRLREWYSYHFPELIKIVSDNSLYAKVIKIIQDRKAMPEDVEVKLEEALMDSTKVKNILEVARSSMGMDISPLDMINIQTFATRVIALTAYRKQLMEYLKNKMHDIAPNLATLIGDTVGARLISHAGSLTNLAKYPASTVQILGAEKALFRAIRTRGNTPKYGLIFHSTFIGRAAKENKGRISRFLANKCSIASRIDCFSDIPTEVFGQKLKQQVEDRLKYFENGTIPAKNIDVMTAASDEATVIQTALAKKQKKKVRKEKRKREKDEEALANSTISIMGENSFCNSSAANSMGSFSNSLTENGAEDDEHDISLYSPKKKKRKSNESSQDANSFVSEGNEDEESNTTPRKKKKKKKNKSMNEAVISPSPVKNAPEEVVAITPFKKKKNKSMNEAVISPSPVKNSPEVVVITPFKKKKNKSMNEVVISPSPVKNAPEEVISASKKKKNKKQVNSTIDSSMADTIVELSESFDVDTSGKKKKKKMKSNEL